MEFENFKQILNKQIFEKSKRSLLESNLIISELLPMLFPENKTLNLLMEHFKKKELPIYQSLATKLCQYMNK